MRKRRPTLQLTEQGSADRSSSVSHRTAQSARWERVWSARRALPRGAPSASQPAESGSVQSRDHAGKRPAIGDHCAQLRVGRVGSETHTNQVEERATIEHNIE